VPEPDITQAPAPDIKFNIALIETFALDPLPNNYQEAFQLTNGTIVPNATINSDKLNDIKLKEELNLSNTKFGKVFKVASKRQSLSTIVRRMIPKGAKTHIDMASMGNYANRWRRMFLKDISVESLNAELYKNLLAVYKKYAQSNQLPNIDYNLQALNILIRTHLKEIEKIKNSEAAYADKAGQSISAWAKELNSAFCVYFRSIETLLINAMDPKFIFANGLSDEEIQSKLNQFTNWIVAMCADCPEFDSTQTKFTQMIEKYVFNFLMKNESLDLYYSVRMACRAVSEVMNYVNSIVKTSGEPCTLLANTVLLFFLVTLLIDPSEIEGMAGKGDDSLVLLYSTCKRFKLNLKVYNRFIVLDPKAMFTEIPEFCSYLYYKRTWFYDYVHLARKMLSRNFKEETFSEYKLSIIDKLKPYYLHRPIVIEALQQFYKQSRSVIECGIESMNALCFMSWKEVQPLLVRHFIEV
jgi:translation initiation factor 2 beta subunit (eIF-2beta)/eIF-5